MGNPLHGKALINRLSSSSLDEVAPTLLYTFTKPEGITCEILGHLYSRCNAVRSSYLDLLKATVHKVKPGISIKSPRSRGSLLISICYLVKEATVHVTLTIKSRVFIANRFLRKSAQHVLASLLKVV